MAALALKHIDAASFQSVSSYEELDLILKILSPSSSLATMDPAMCAIRLKAASALKTLPNDLALSTHLQELLSVHLNNLKNNHWIGLTHQETLRLVSMIEERQLLFPLLQRQLFSIASLSNLEEDHAPILLHLSSSRPHNGTNPSPIYYPSRRIPDSWKPMSEPLQTNRSIQRVAKRETSPSFSLALWMKRGAFTLFIGWLALKLRGMLRFAL